MDMQSNPKVTDYNFETGEVVEREATAEEVASWAEAIASAEAIRQVQ
jgi:hypothetical protein